MKKRIICTTAVFVCSCSLLQAQSSSVDTMSYYRAQIDSLDNQIIDLIGQRTGAARAIGVYKMNHEMSVVQQQRFDAVLQEAIERGKDNQLSEEFIRDLFIDIHKESIRQEAALKEK